MKAKIGAMFITIVMIVSGMYFVTENYIKFVKVLAAVLKVSEPNLSFVRQSHVSFLIFLFSNTSMMPIPSTERMNSIAKGVRSGSRS